MAEDLSRFCCLNADCPQYGQRAQGNIAVRARYGPHKTRLLYCKSCQQRFSQRQGTPLFDSGYRPSRPTPCWRICTRAAASARPNA